MALYIEATGGGRVQRLPVGGGRLRLEAEPGMRYRLLDDAGRVPATVAVKRVGDNLVLDGLPNDAVVEIDRFFTRCTPERECALATDTITGSTEADVTPASQPVAALSDGSFVFNVPEALASASPEPVLSESEGTSYRPLLVGLGALALAGAGGGGGGGGGGSSAAAPPPTGGATSDPGAGSTPTGGTSSGSTGGGPAPSAPTLTSAKVTHDPTPVLAGAADPGTRVTVVVQDAAGVPIANFQANADASGQWTIDTGSASPTAGSWSASGVRDGAYTIVMRATSAGGVTGANGIATLTVDTTPPAAPSLGTIAGNDIVGFTEAGGPLVLSGSAEASSKVFVQLGSIAHTVTAGAGGAWSSSFATSEFPADGANVVASVYAQDAAGNKGAATAHAVRFDTSPPGAPSFANPALVGSTRPTVGGFAEPGTTVTLTIDRNLDGIADAQYTTTAAAGGVWSVNLATATPVFGGLPAGGLAGGSSARLIAVATDAAGNASPGGEQVLTVTTVLAAPPTVNAIAGDNVVDRAEATASAGVVVSGTNPLNARPVTLVWSDGAGHSITKTPTVSGANWTTTITPTELATLSAGAQTINATYLGGTGGASAPGSQWVLLDRTAPAAPTVAAVTADNVVSLGEAATGVTVSGTAEANATVVVTWGSASKTVVASPASAWSAAFLPGEVPASGSPSITAVARDWAGNSSATTTHPVTFDRVTPRDAPHAPETIVQKTITLADVLQSPDGPAAPVPEMGAPSTGAAPSAALTPPTSYAGDSVSFSHDATGSLDALLASRAVMPHV